MDIETLNVFLATITPTANDALHLLADFVCPELPLVSVYEQVAERLTVAFKLRSRFIVAARCLCINKVAGLKREAPMVEFFICFVRTVF
ncbi:MAG: hypothetical protein ACFE0S_10235 [Rhodospirillales bacterium]